jgi:hypothetical protein
VWDGQGKVTMIEKRFMDSSAQMDIKDKLAEALVIRSREGTVLISAVSSTLTNRTGNTSNTEISRRTESDNVILQLQDRLARLEAEMVTASMDRIQVQDKIGSLEQRMTQMSNSALHNILARLQEAANRVQDAQGKVTIIEKRLKRCTDSSVQMDIEDKLTEALEKRSREGTILEQIRQEAKNKAQELNITLTLEQLRTDV